MIEFPIIETEGTPYEMGLQHGRQARKQIQACFQRFCPPQGRTEERRQRAATIERTIAQRMPEALEEMQGIAEGAGLPYEDILLLNFAIELWLEEVLVRPLSGKDCTLIGMAGTEPLVAKNMDMLPGDDEYVICHRARPSSGYDFLHMTYAGTVWTDGGINAAGLAQSNSSLWSNSCNWSNFPIFLTTRYLLQTCGTVSQAIEVAQRYDAINAGSNILLGDSSGDFAVIEKSVAQATRRLEVDPRTPGQVGEVIFATNHSVTPEMEPLLGGGEAFLANSRQRFDNLTRLVGAVSTDLEGVMSLLRDHSTEVSICQHGHTVRHTVAAFIASPRQKRLWVGRGYPCQSQFRRVTL